MYRIVKETNHLTDTVLYFIEEYRGFIFKSWTRDIDLNIFGVSGPVGGTSYEGAKWKLDRIKLNGGKMLTREVI